MQSNEPVAGVALIKRSAWLGTKISFAVLGPICVLCWLVIGGPVLYKSASFGVSPLELMRSADAMSAGPGSPTHLSRILDGLIAAAELVVVGVAFSALTGAAIGAIAAVISHRLRRSSCPEN